jgi:hypothetical protein
MVPLYPITFFPQIVNMIVITKLIVLSCLISIIIMTNEVLAQNQSRADMLDLDIQGMSAFVPEGRNIYTITGEVSNENIFPFNSVQVSATLYDNNGQVVGVGSGFMGGVGAVNNFTLQVAGDLQVQLFQ